MGLFDQDILDIIGSSTEEPDFTPSGGGELLTTYEPHPDVSQWSDIIDTAIAENPSKLGFDVDKNWINRIIEQESGGDQFAESYAGATGVMQLMPETAESLGVLDSTDPEENIRGGVKLIAQLLDKYDGDKRKVMAAYNGGEQGVDQAVEKYGEQWLAHLDEFKGEDPYTGQNHAVQTWNYIDAIERDIPSGPAKTFEEDIAGILGIDITPEAAPFEEEIPEEERIEPPEKPGKKPVEETEMIAKKAEDIYMKVAKEGRDLTPDEYKEAMAGVSELPALPFGMELGELPEEERKEFEKYAIERAKPIPKETEEFVEQLSMENKINFVNHLIDIGEETLAGKIVHSSAAFGKGFLEKFPGAAEALGIKETVAGKVLKERKPVSATAGGVTAFITQAMAGGAAVSGALSKTAISKSPVLMNTLTRMITTGAITGKEQDWKNNFGESLLNTVQAMGAGAVSVIPEIYAPGNAWQLLAQPLADLVYDVGVGKIRGQNVASAEWWKNEALNLAMAEGFAIRDLASGMEFRSQQAFQRSEIKELGTKGFSLIKKAKAKIPVTKPKAEKTEFLPGAEKRIKTTVEKYREEELGKGIKEPEAIRKVTEEVEEKVEVIGKRGGLEAKRPVKRGYEEYTKEEIGEAHTALLRESERAELSYEEARGKLDTELEGVEFASKLRQDIQKDLGFKTTTGDQWQALIGKKTRDKEGNLIKRTPELEAKLSNIAEAYNLINKEGRGASAIDAPPDAVLKSIDNWQSDDVANLISQGMTKGGFGKFKKEWEGLSAKAEEEYEVAFEEIGKRGEAITSRMDELKMSEEKKAPYYAKAYGEEEIFKVGKEGFETGSLYIPAPEGRFRAEGAEPLKQRIKTSPLIKGIKKWFISDQGLPQSIVNERVKRNGAIHNQTREVERDIGTLWDGMKKEYGRKWNKLTDKEEYRLNEALNDETKIKNLPAGLQPQVKSFRAVVDGLSQKLIDSGMLSDDLVVIFKRDKGIYLHRQYRLWKDKKWKNRMLNVKEGDKVAYDLRNNAKTFLYNEIASNPKEVSKLFGAKTQKEIDQVLEGKVDELLQISDSPMSIFTGNNEVSAEVRSILKKRGEFDPAVRALWGEYKLLDYNYAQTVLKQTKMLENHKMFTNIAKNNMGKYFFDGAIKKEGVSYSKKIDAGTNPALKPLDGKYTTKEIYDEIVNMDKKTPLPYFVRQWMRGISFTKKAKTLLQQMTHIRNFTANPFMTNSLGNLYDIKLAGYTKKSIVETIELIRNKDSLPVDLQALLEDAIGRGIVGESVNANILKEVANDAKIETIEQFVGLRKGSGLRKFSKLPEKLYSAEDDFFKLLNYQAEINTYRKAYPNKSDSEIRDMAAEIIRNCMQTYSKIPKAIQELRRFPLVGTFPSFSYETIRNTGNIMKLATKEMKSGNPVLQKKAAKRIVGLTSSMTLTPAVWGAVGSGVYGSYMLAYNYLTGKKKKEEKKTFSKSEKEILQKNFIAPWSKNSDIAIVDYRDGAYYYIDVSYSNPYASQFKNPYNAFMKGEDWKGKLLGTAGEFLRPYMSEDIFTSAVLDLSRNLDKSGNKIYNESDKWENQIVDAINHFSKKVEPGFITAARRFYRAMNKERPGYSGNVDDVNNEIIAQTTGIRVSKCDPLVSLSFHAYDFKDKLSGAKRLEYRKGKELSYGQQKKQYKWLADKVNAAFQLGYTRKEVFTVLKKAGVSKAGLLLEGKYEEYFKKLETE